MCTPEFIDKLPKNSIFVYGSNQFNIAGAGSAKTAVDKFGAIYKDCPMGLCGQSYGIITKSFNDEEIKIGFIREQVNVLYHFSKVRPDLTFYVTKIGVGLAGWPISLIADIFKDREYMRPSNIILPIEFSTQ